MINVTRIHFISGRKITKELPITAEKMAEWDSYGKGNHSRPKIQDFFPELSDSNREFILTGLSDDDWDDLYAEC